MDGSKNTQFRPIKAATEASRTSLTGTACVNLIPSRTEHLYPSQRILKDILETPVTTDLDPFDTRSLTNLQNHYHACLDEKEMDELGIAPLLDVVKVVKQLFNGSSSIEPHFAEWRAMIQDTDIDYSEAEPFDTPQLILHGGEIEESHDKRREKRGRKEKEKKKERKRKLKERKRKQKQEKKKQKQKQKKQKKEQKRLLKEAERAKREGLTAALAFMHSRGTSKHPPKSWLRFTKYCRHSRIIPVRHRRGHWKRSQCFNALVRPARPRSSFQRVL